MPAVFVLSRSIASSVFIVASSDTWLPTWIGEVARTAFSTCLDEALPVRGLEKHNAAIASTLTVRILFSNRAFIVSLSLVEPIERSSDALGVQIRVRITTNHSRQRKFFLQNEIGRAPPVTASVESLSRPKI